MQKYPQINVRIDDAFLEHIDDWRRRQDDLPSRPEAIRRLVELSLRERVKERLKLEDSHSRGKNCSGRRAWRK